MSFVTYQADGAIGTILLNRPEALNALNSKVLDELNAVLDRVDQNVIRCLIISGSGEKAFAAGADIGEMYHLNEEEGKAFSKKGNDLFRRIETFPLPVIAAVNGYALGGGCELAMACDIRIASENAVFGQPETGLGNYTGLWRNPASGAPDSGRLCQADDLHRPQYQGGGSAADRSCKQGRAHQ